MIISLILTSILFYFIGSLPTGYLLVKKKFNRDLTREGSKNVGTLNTLVVSKSKLAAAFVLVIDFLKGALPVYFLIYIFKLSPLFVFVPGIFLIVGHNYPVWLKFKGGRGLATAAGMFSLINFLLLANWCAVWLLYFFIIKRDILAANFISSLTFPVFAFAFKDLYASGLYSVDVKDSYSIFLIFCFTVSVVLILGHREIFNRFRTVKNNPDLRGRGRQSNLSNNNKLCSKI